MTALTSQKFATGLQLAVLHLLATRLDECRNACPGIGGDVDAMNLRFLIQTKDWAESAVRQAADTLERLAKSINSVNPGSVKPKDALDAVRLLFAQAEAVAALGSVVESGPLNNGLRDENTLARAKSAHFNATA